jgi:hypothetical protein
MLKRDTLPHSSVVKFFDLKVAADAPAVTHETPAPISLVGTKPHRGPAHRFTGRRRVGRIVLMRGPNSY